MNKIIQVLSLLLFAFSSLFAQGFPNASFEDWDTISGIAGKYENPVGWSTSNTYTTLITGPGVVKSTFAHSGTYSAQAATLPIGFAGQPYAGFVVNGYPTLDSALSGQPDLITGGTPLSFLPDRVTGWYRFTTTSAFDSATVEVYLKRWNASLKNRDTIGYGYGQLATTGSFKTFQIPIQVWNGSLQPDSIVVAFYSSHVPLAKHGGELWVDDVDFDTLSTGLQAWQSQVEFNLYREGEGFAAEWKLPPGLGKAELEVFDLQGRNIGQVDLPGPMGRMALPIDLGSGIYVVRLLAGGQVLATQKLRK